MKSIQNDGFSRKRVDSPSFDDFVQAEQKGLTGLANAILFDIDDAHDAVQDVFETMLKQWDELETPRNFACTCIRNKAIDILRKKIRDRNNYETFAPLMMPAPSGELVDIGYLVADLDEDDRFVVVGHYLAGYTYKEIAVALGWNQSTVRSRSSRAIKQLSRQFEGM